MDDNKKKKYAVPEVEVVKFPSEDIILASLTNGGEDPMYDDPEGENY